MQPESVHHCALLSGLVKFGVATEEEPEGAEEQIQVQRTSHIRLMGARDQFTINQWLLAN